MTYDVILKDLAIWTDLLRISKRDISTGKTRRYVNVLNELKRLGKTIRSLEKMLDKQDDEEIYRRRGNVRNSMNELQDIVSDSIFKPDSYVEVEGLLGSFIAELNDLSELLAESK